MSAPVRKKIMVVGDGNCGKTCMLLRFKDQTFVDDYIPTICTEYMLTVNVDARDIELSLFDTSGQDVYDNLRQLSYKKTDVVIIVFSIADPDSLDNVTQVWLPEVRHFLPHAPIVLAGNKTDLRGDAEVITKLKKRQRQPVARDEGEAIARRIKAVKYLECSAKHEKDLATVKEVFITAARSSLQNTPSSRKCHLI